MFRRPLKNPSFVYNIQSKSTFSLRVKIFTFLTYVLTFDIDIVNINKKNVPLDAVELRMSYHRPLEMLSAKKLLDILVRP